jgi:hypothetical protein
MIYLISLTKCKPTISLPGILKKKTQLIWGMGPTYKEKIVTTLKGISVLEIYEDPEIDAC